MAANGNSREKMANNSCAHSIMEVLEKAMRVIEVDI